MSYILPTAVPFQRLSPQFFLFFSEKFPLELVRAQLSFPLEVPVPASLLVPHVFPMFGSSQVYILRSRVSVSHLLNVQSS